MKKDSRVKTSRKGIISENAIVPKLVSEVIKRGSITVNNILDFGCGENLVHVNKLSKLFPQINFEGYDIGFNYPESRKYDLIFASNVLNVQTNFYELLTTLQEIYSLQNSKITYVIVNYPKNPRYLNLTVNELESILYFWWHPISIQSDGTKVWQLSLENNCQPII